MQITCIQSLICFSGGHMTCSFIIIVVFVLINWETETKVNESKTRVNESKTRVNESKTKVNES